MKKIGIFLNGEKMCDYPFQPELFKQVVNDCQTAIEETGEFHELRVFEEIEESETKKVEPMTAGELRKYLTKRYIEDRKTDELRLAIVTSDRSIGARSHVYVRAVSEGFDWESGLFMIHTDQSITKKQPKKKK